MTCPLGGYEDDATPCDNVRITPMTVQCRRCGTITQSPDPAILRGRDPELD